MINSICAELLKIRKSSIVWLLWLTGLGLSLSIAVFYVKGPESFVTMGKNPWTKYTSFSLSLFSMFVFPFFVLLLTSSNILLEHRSNSWKSIFTLSNPKWSILLSKLISLLVLMLVVCLLYVISTLLFGYLIDIIVPEYEFNYYATDMPVFLLHVCQLYISVLGILGIQFFLSLSFSNQLYPLIIGIILIILGFLLTLTETAFSSFFPYSFPMNYKDFGIISNSIELDRTAFFERFEFISILTLILFLIFSYQKFIRIR